MILKAARAHAAFEGRDAITERDIALAAELALPHRLKRSPFHQVEVSIDELQSQIEHIQSQVEGEESEQALAGNLPTSPSMRPCEQLRRSKREGNQRQSIDALPSNPPIFKKKCACVKLQT
ncbi:MAG: hypothetical protein P8Z41_04515 [Anaerolineales bacterium]